MLYLQLVNTDLIEVCLPPFVKHSCEKPTKVDKLVSDFVYWSKSVLTGPLAKKVRMLYLILLLWITPVATLVKMHNDYNDLRNLKNEMLMEDKTLVQTLKEKQSADTATMMRNVKLEQNATGQAI